MNYRAAVGVVELALRDASRMCVIAGEVDVLPKSRALLGTSLQAAVPALEVLKKTALKDHEIANVVNSLCSIAREYHDAQQLRERIASFIVPFLREERSP